MKKLKVEIDALAVESFEASDTLADAGTVEGLAYTPGCDSIRICLPNDPSYDPCGETYSPCGDTRDPVCTGSQGFTACTCVGTTGC
ncbi:MAG TPA: hypothetical protein VGO40_16555 [Longimicrobium sp.]|jgi:hypothetical protein|nr:hypothetical protein [Longimicrobium sp.]